MSTPAVNRVMGREELWRRIRHGPPLTIVEALGYDYFAVAHLPGARNITAHTTDRAIAEMLPDRSGTVVVYGGADGTHARRVASRLADLGYRDVRVYEQGKEEWMAAGLPIETGDTPPA